MATTRDTFLALMRTFLQDAGKFLADPDDLINCLNEALEQYAEDKPLEKAADITGDGTKEYDFPSDFIDGFSELRKVEFPQGNDPPDFIREGKDNDFIRERTPTKIQLRFLTDTPLSTQTIRLTYTTTYTVNDSSSNVVSADEHAVSNLATSFCLRALAARHNQTVDSTIGADAVDRLAAAAQFAALADSKETIYNKKIGKVSDTITAALAIGEVDVVPQIGGVRLFHHHRRAKR